MCRHLHARRESGSLEFQRAGFLRDWNGAFCSTPANVVAVLWPVPRFGTGNFTWPATELTEWFLLDARDQALSRGLHILAR